MKSNSKQTNQANEQALQPQNSSNSVNNIRSESIKEEEENSNIATINNESQNKSEKEDNNSDMSSLVNQKIDAQEIKIVKKAKIKKGDFDRKSHLSHNIEGVIFEDINEDEDWEEKDKILSANNINDYLVKQKGSTEDVTDKDSMNIKNEILRKINLQTNMSNNTTNNNNYNILNYLDNNKNTSKNQNETYFENINFNDVNAILKRNNSVDNSAKQTELINTSKTNIMQELLKHRNLAFVNEADKKENKNEKQILEFNNDNNITDSNRLRHFNSTPIKNSAIKDSSNNQANAIKEKYITFENESETDIIQTQNKPNANQANKGSFNNLLNESK